MTKYVIRSMTTTDATRDNAPVPYHVYLIKPEKRRGAYWCRCSSDIATFDSIEAAQAEIDRSLPQREVYEPLQDIVPQDDRAVPTFWDARRDQGLDVRRRVIGTEVVTVPNPIVRDTVPSSRYVASPFSFDRG